MKVNFYIASIKALVQSCQYNQGLSPIISTPNELMRFILTNCQRGNCGEDYTGQILNPMLKRFKFQLPTKMKKFIMEWFDRKTKSNHKAQQTAETLYANEDWWKRMFLHAHWCNASKFNRRYPNTKRLLDYLYMEDRSWTFNARYAAAQEQGDYEKAIVILTEKPGLLPRNMLMFCKYVKGVALPVKAQDGTRARVPENPLTAMLSHSKGKQKTAVRVVTSDAQDWMRKAYATFLKIQTPTIKTLYQMLEVLNDEEHEKPIHSRMVQGNEVKYSTPIPAINVKMKDLVTRITLDHINNTKKETELNKSLGKVYLDPDLEGVSLQYSGANSNEIGISGSFLAPGTIVPLPKGDMIRMGVVWKDVGSGSCDIDLSTTISGKTGVYNCYYGRPTTTINNTIIATSSGDITSCGSRTYSAEFIDIDIKAAKTAGVDVLFNSLIMYSGATLADYDTHCFISTIKKADRVTERRNISIDLAKQDYAVKLTDKVKAYLGMSIDLNTMSMKSLAISDGITQSNYNNANTLLERFASQIGSQKSHFNTKFALLNSIDESQLVSDPKDADIIIGITNKADINVLTNAEDVQVLVF